MRDLPEAAYGRPPVKELAGGPLGLRQGGENGKEKGMPGNGHPLCCWSYVMKLLEKQKVQSKACLTQRRYDATKGLNKGLSKTIDGYKRCVVAALREI